MQNIQDPDIIYLWKAYSQQLEHLLVNRRNAEDITRLKVQSFLASMKPIKIFTILAGILWVGFVDVLIIGSFHMANPFFLISAGIQVILTKLAIGIYLYQLVLIHQVTIDEPVMATQQKLARLRSSTLLVTRLLFLQLPVWTTFYWNKTMLENGNLGLYIIQIIITLSFTGIAIWLFCNIKYENRHKKWFRLLFGGKEWDPVIRSMELLKDIEEFNG